MNGRVMLSASVSSLILLLLPACVSNDARVDRAVEEAGTPLSSPLTPALPPGAIDTALADLSKEIRNKYTREDLVQSGMLNVLTKLETTLAKVETTIDTKINVANKVGGEGDNITTWILAASWILYPMVWRPLRQWRERRKGQPADYDPNSTLPL